MSKTRFSIKKRNIAIIILSSIIYAIIVAGFLIRVKVDDVYVDSSCLGQPLCELSIRTKEVTVWDRIFNYSGWFDGLAYNRDECPFCFIFRGE